METLTSTTHTAAVGYFKTEFDTFGTGDNLTIRFSFSTSQAVNAATLRAKAQAAVEAIDHKHLHLESPDWHKPSESKAYGLRRSVQALLFLIEQDQDVANHLRRLEISNGVGHSVLFEKKI
jgi:hypothetical protein